MMFTIVKTAMPRAFKPLARMTAEMGWECALRQSLTLGHDRAIFLKATGALDTEPDIGPAAIAFASIDRLKDGGELSNDRI